MKTPEDITATLPPVRGWRVLGVLVIALLGLGIVANGVVASYEAVHAFAVLLGIPAPERVATGFEAALIVIVSWDIVLSWLERPVPLLRWMARVLTVLSVVVNAAAGWPVLRAMLLYLPAPLTVLAIVEATRHVLMAKHRVASQKREPIPFARWVLHRSSSRQLQKLMVKWEITSYREALQMQQRIEHAKKLLEVSFGSSWRRLAGADLVWMLDEGVMLETALERVYRIVESRGGETGQGGGSRSGNQDKPKPRRQDTGQDKKRDRRPDTSGDSSPRSGQREPRQDNGQDKRQDTAERGQEGREKLPANMSDSALIAEWKARWVTNPGRPTITATYAIGTDKAIRLMAQAWPEETSRAPIAAVNGSH